ncbi:MAG: H4MPT-linked C1 transfer pathway protein [Archaeoglobaceae archaeon]|nr:H4MPT-linked C1 transfer pathway protein [Archaeoglobaceae archaeon]MDW8117674.1 hydantoinase/oxoprolinase family protein [Archaeoglobaceae archaeon]
MNSLGIDIGGANLKVSDGQENRIIYFPMWKKAPELKDRLKEISKEFKAEKAGVVITAELADVFKSKREGIEYITSICKEVFKEVYFLDVEGRLKKNIDDPMKFCASNWMASVSFLLKEGFRDFLFVDMGSTTIDLIPVKERAIAGKTDFERLRRKELIYIGVLRTPVFYVLRKFAGVELCPEYFAITADIFRVTGDLKEEDYNCETPDSGGKSVKECMQRIARTVCCDLEELGEMKVKLISFKAKKAIIKILQKEIEAKVLNYDLKRVLACGIGEFLIEQAFECIKLSEKYGNASKLFPAFAMLKLVEKT